ncbi:FAD/NAD(P)-binding protein [Saccharothrix variisporea]|uniref:NAD(P)H-flavin reductase n=1 Tax=Saccharothrix variisporea TaxID=543527 RepID=A0A495XPY8_9PSEU|nr:FAD/NAD(P)-binding protein [Saccharothrix variisporea]RKT74513.1 NAD(P)H-flavin reductase [Saccharothrix variisporea]
MTDPWLPVAHRVVRRVEETADTATLRLRPVHDPLPPFRPGQFAMLYAHGVGEVPISVSAIPGSGDLVHTVRAVGAVSRALHGAEPGTVLGARGPFGTTWEPHGTEDLLVVAGGIGLAPLRPVLRHALAHRDRYRRVVLVVGARTPADLCYRDEFDRWAAELEVVTTVDHGAPGWTGRVGFVTEPLAVLPLDAPHTTALLCGPEPMMRFSARTLITRGVPPDRIQVSLERNMQCGTGRCGHCQLGPLLLCRDGPVVAYPVAEELFAVKEL